MAGFQTSLFPVGETEPRGLLYQQGFLGEKAERDLAARIAALPLKPFEFQGFLGKRRTHSFGMHYGFDGSGLSGAEAMPPWLLELRERAAAFAGIEAAAMRHALLIEYAPGAGIGWHRDRPEFGDVIGISLLAPARLRFRRKPVLSDDEGAGTKWERTALTAEPRSAYLLRGPARTEWEHSIPPMETLRYSITLRTLKAPQL